MSNRIVRATFLHPYSWSGTTIVGRSTNRYDLSNINEVAACLKRSDNRFFLLHAWPSKISI